MQQPVASIIITTYNRAHVLLRSLQSALAQTERNIEVLVVDDGSTDDTEPVVIAANDSRIRYIRLPKNQGASAARNRGIQEARGNYILVWDSDDVLYPTALQRLTSIFEEHPNCVVVSAPARMMRNGSEEAALSLPEGMVTMEQVLCKSTGNNEKVRLALREAYLNAPYVSRNVDFIVSARLRAQGEWYHLHDPLGDVVLDNPDSLTRSRKKFDPARSAERAPQLHQYMLDFGGLLKKACLQRYGEIAYGAAIACSCAGMSKEARHYAIERWKTAPLSPRSYMAILSSIFLPHRRD